MKERYLNELNEALMIVFSINDANTITNDYQELYEDYLSSGLTEEEVIKKLGEPKEIVKSLIEEQKRIFPLMCKRNVTLPKRRGRKIIAIMPFLSVIIFLILGYTFEVWHPGWLVFFLIPVSAILFKPYKKQKIVALSPFIAVTIFILVGTYVKQGYQYSWIAFFLIPLISILVAND